MSLKMLKQLKAKKIGPILDADVTLGDLTIFVGPQATGKSIFLQLIKLLIDRDAIHETIQSSSMSRQTKKDEFFRQFFGEGMDSIWDEESRLYLGRSSKPVDMNKYRKRSRSKNSDGEQVFYIPAQRVMCLKDGLTRTFTDYRTSDPFIIKDFSQKIHEIMRDELDGIDDVFPRSNRLTSTLRQPLIDHIFGGYELKKDENSELDRLVLQRSTESVLPYLVWSAGQREFVPLLLGLYWLLPPSRLPRREPFRLVVLEEPENGLHPNAIGAVLNLLFEILARDYKVIIATHSPYILDVVWAIKVAQEEKASIDHILRLLSLRKNAKTKSLATSVLAAKYRTYFFQRSGIVQDISSLDVDDDDKAINGWGGLSSFSGDVGEVVASMVRL